MNIKTKEASSLLVAVLAAAIVALATALAHVAWWVVLCVAVGTFLIVALFALFVIRKYVAYKLKPIYSIVFSRNVHTHEILDELKDKHVESISEELSAWAETSDMEIARLKETEKFRKEYLGNVAHELKTPIFNIQGYISTLLDGGLEDELINRKYLERTEKSIDRLINIVNDLQTRKRHDAAQNGAVRRRGAHEGDRRPVGDEGRRAAHQTAGEGGRRSAVALLGLGRQALCRAGDGQPADQLDLLRPRGRPDARASCSTRS